jgi:ArsR family transcriptional regulator
MIAPAYNDGFVFKNDEIEYTCQSLKAICHPVRLEILNLIGGNVLSVQEIAERVGLSQSTTSQHLAALRTRDLLVTRKSANRVYYKIRNPRLLEFIKMMGEIFANPREKQVSWPNAEQLDMANITKTATHSIITERM